MLTEQLNESAQAQKLCADQLTEAAIGFLEEWGDRAPTDIEVQAVVAGVLGESLTHEQIMCEAPRVMPGDLYLIERPDQMWNNVGYTPKEVAFNYNITLPQQLKLMVTQYKLGKDGLRKFYQAVLKTQRDIPSQGLAIAKVAGMMGMAPKDATLLFGAINAKRKSVKEDVIFESWLDMLAEEGEPTNTADSTMPGKEPTDGKPTDKGNLKRRKKKDCDCVNEEADQEDDDDDDDESPKDKKTTKKDVPESEEDEDSDEDDGDEKGESQTKDAKKVKGDPVKFHENKTFNSFMRSIEKV